MVFHQHRARTLLQDAYDVQHANPDRSLIEAAQAHRRCIHINEVRLGLGTYRDKIKVRWERARFIATYEPYAGPNGTTWAVPWPIPMCESGASNVSPSGYYGILVSTWTDPHWGGTQYGPTPASASKDAQSIVAHQIWLEVGQQAWECQAG